MDPLTQWLLEALAPLEFGLSSPERFSALLRELGWDARVSAILLDEDGPLGEIMTELNAVFTQTQELRTAVALLAEDEDSPAQVIVEILQLATAMISLIQQLAGAEAHLTEVAEELDELFTSPSFWLELVAELPGYLFVRAIDRLNPALYAVLAALGIVERETKVVSGLSTSIDRLRWDRLPKLISGPDELIREVYRWREGFDHHRFVRAIDELCCAAGCRVELHEPSPTFSEVLGFFAHDAEAAAVRQVTASLANGQLASGGWGELGFEMAPVPLTPGQPCTGIYFGAYVMGGLSGSVRIGRTWSLELGATGNAALAGLHFDPSFSQVRLIETAGAGEVSLALVGAPERAWTVLSLGTGPSLRASGLEVEFGADANELYVEVGIDVELGIAPSGGDAFVREAYGDEPMTVSIAPRIGWSSVNGVYFAGGAMLQLRLVVDLQLGPVRVDWIDLALTTDDETVELTAGLTGALELGPLTVTLERVGLSAKLTASDASVGGLQNDIAFLPPTGAGLAIDAAGVVSGGGFLDRNPDTGEYAGILELSMLGVGLTATGLLATRLPNGAEGWSLFFSLAATFTGVQLGFGFTLNGVGGLIGINRGLDERALGDGIRTGVLDSILFPDDPIADAPRILRDIDAIFPVAVGQYVFGPVAKIGWGTPTLLELDVGVVLQLPDPLTVSLLGSLSAVLPSEDAVIVELHVDVAGTLNLSEGTLRVDASLRDSRVLTLELTGDMAVRAAFRDSPSFLIAFGGFHPDFKPPADFPALERLGVALDTGDDLRITLGGYLALTSNTVQFGAEFTLWAKAVGFTAEGGASFDALIQFKPFGFVIRMKVWVSISAGNKELFGVLLAGKLSGPNPWHAVGEATFKLLGCKKTLEIEATFGAKASEPPKQSIDVGALLIEELGIDSAWTVLPPASDGESGIVVGEASSAELTVHPAGRVEVRQRIVPLDTRIDQYGNAKLAGADQFTLASPRLGAVAIDDAEAVSDWFAAAHYFELDDDEKLSAPSFEQLPAGLRMGNDQLEGGEAVDYTYDHELVYRDPNVRGEARERTGKIVSSSRKALDRALMVGAAIGAREAGKLPRSTAQAGVVAVVNPSFVASEASTGASSPATPTAVSYFAAREQLRRASDSSACVLIPSYELELIA